VARYHGVEAAHEARAAFQHKFQAREFPEDPDARLVLTNADVKDAAAPAMTLLEIVAKTGLVPSKSEGRRLIVQGGVEVDDEKMIDPNASIKLAAGRQYRLRVGRRKFAVAEYKAER
jgi:tyrosyl-tRNA synthetase